MGRPQLWLLIGGNGAGKSTFYQRYLAPRGVRFINADELAKLIAPSNPEAASYEAARQGELIRYEMLKRRESFCFETVFSHPSKIDFIASAKGFGYEVILIFIHLDNPSLNQARVAERVEAGGHNVPADKVASRIPRTLQHAKTAIALCDRMDALDNSSADHPFQRIFTIVNGEVTIHCKLLPAWASELLEQ